MREGKGGNIVEKEKYEERPFSFSNSQLRDSLGRYIQARNDLRLNSEIMDSEAKKIYFCFRDYVKSTNDGRAHKFSELLAGFYSEVLFLDEPTLGLDVNIAKDLRNFIRDKVVREQGKTVLLTTHYMYEAEEMCDRVGFLSKGKLVAVGASEELKSKMPSGFSIEMLVARLTEEAISDLRRLKCVKKVITADYEGESEGEKVDRLIINVDNDKALPQVLSYMASKQCRVASFNLRGPTLEDLFMFYTGEK